MDILLLQRAGHCKTTTRDGLPTPPYIWSQNILIKIVTDTFVIDYQGNPAKRMEGGEGVLTNEYKKNPILLLSTVSTLSKFVKNDSAIQVRMITTSRSGNKGAGEHISEFNLWKFWEILRTYKETLRTYRETLRTYKEILRTYKETLRTYKETLRNLRLKFGKFINILSIISRKILKHFKEN